MEGLVSREGERETGRERKVCWCVNMVSFRHHKDMDYGIFLPCHCVYPHASLCLSPSSFCEGQADYGGPAGNSYTVC